MRLVSACTLRTSASCSSVVMPGLSTMKSLPCRITSMPSGARSFGIEALTTSWIVVSSRISVLAARQLRLREALRERRDQIRLLREERDQLAAAADDRLDLPVDVAVVQADGGKANRAGRGGAAGGARAAQCARPRRRHGCS